MKNHTIIYSEPYAVEDGTRFIDCFVVLPEFTLLVYSAFADDPEYTKERLEQIIGSLVASEYKTAIIEGDYRITPPEIVYFVKQGKLNPDEIYYLTATAPNGCEYKLYIIHVDIEGKYAKVAVYDLGIMHSN